MIELTEMIVVNRILEMLIGGRDTLDIRSECRAVAPRYLQQCLRLFGVQQKNASSDKTRRVEHVQIFARLLSALAEEKMVSVGLEALEAGQWPEENDDLEDAAIVIALQILSKPQPDYLHAIRSYLCEYLEHIFSEAGNPESSQACYIRLKLITDCLRYPVVLTMSEVRRLVRYVRMLQERKDRKGKNDLRILLALWRTMFERDEEETWDTQAFDVFEKAILEHVEEGDFNTIRLALQIIESFEKSGDSRNMCTARLADDCVREISKHGLQKGEPQIISRCCVLAESIDHLAGGDSKEGVQRFKRQVITELRNTFLEMQTADERKAIADVLIKLFIETGGPQGVKACVECLKDIGVKVDVDAHRWRSTLFDVCTVDDPVTKAKGYLYQLLYDFLVNFKPQLVSNGKEDSEISKNVSEILEKCKEDMFRDQAYMDVLIDKCVRHLDEARPSHEVCEAFIKGSLCLFNFYDTHHLWRKTSRRMSQYQLMKDPNDVLCLHILCGKTVLRLLQSYTYRLGEMNKTVKKDIQTLLNMDTLKPSQGVKDQERGKKLKSNSESNFRICRDVTAVLEGHVNELADEQ